MSRACVTDVLRNTLGNIITLKGVAYLRRRRLRLLRKTILYLGFSAEEKI